MLSFSDSLSQDQPCSMCMHVLQIARDQAAQAASSGVLPSEKQCSKCHQVLHAAMVLLYIRRLACSTPCSGSHAQVPDTFRPRKLNPGADPAGRPVLPQQAHHRQAGEPVQAVQALGAAECDDAHGGAEEVQQVRAGARRQLLRPLQAHLRRAAVPVQGLHEGDAFQLACLPAHNSGYARALPAGLLACPQQWLCPCPSSWPACLPTTVAMPLPFLWRSRA
jgi:hypothetical protein